MKNVIPPLIDFAIQVVLSHPTTFFSTKVLLQSLKLLNHGLRNENLVAQCLSRSREILQQPVFSIIRLTAKEEYDYEADPVGYIRNIFDIAGGSTFPKNECLDLIQAFISKDPSILPDFLQQCYTALKQSSNPVDKESLLLAIGFLSSEVAKDE